MKKSLLIIGFLLSISIGNLHSQTYCTPQSNCFYAPLLSMVTSGALTNLNVTATGCSASGYTLYTNTFVSYPGDTILFSIGLSGLLYTGVKMWVDWNGDSDFLDNGETIWSKQSNLTSVSDTLKVPSNITLGKKRVRIRSNYYSIPTDPCNNQTYGETEDFELTIVSATGTDIAITGIDSPIVYKVGLNTIWIRYTNLAINNITSFDAGYKLDSGTPVTITGISTTLAAGAEKTYKFSTNLNITSPGNHTLKVWVRNPNTIGADNIPTNDTMTINICTGMSGNYTIGKTGTNDFSTFTSAIAAMNSCGIAGPIVFNVNAATYNERVEVPFITGMSAVNTVTFDGLTLGNATISFTGGSSQRAVVVFNRSAYVTFKKFKIVNNGNPSYGVFFGQGSTYNTITDCEISITSSTGNNYGVVMSFSEDLAATSGGAINNNSVVNTTITGGSSNIFLKGSYPYNYIYYNKIIGNTLLSASSSAIEINAGVRTTVQYNKISNLTVINSKGINNIYCAGSIIDGNIINPGTFGIYLSYENLYYSDSTVITNNMISNFKSTSKQVGIYSYNDFLLRIYHNSIRVDGSIYDSTSSAIYLWYTKGPSIMNNILSSSGYTYLLSMNIQMASINANIDYNLYYYPGSTANKFYNYNKGYANLAAFKTDNNKINFPHDINSFDQKNPYFTSNSDLHIASSSPTYNGIKIWVAKDVDGDVRCPFGSVLGADEGSFQGSKPVAGFTSDDSVCYGTPVIFVNKYPATSPLGHKWYKDGVYASNDVNYQFTFPTGKYSSVIKVVSTNCYGVDSFSKTIYIDAPTKAPDASFLAEKNIIAPYDEIRFFDGSTDCPSQWEWKVSPAYFNDPYLGYVPTHYFVNFTTKNSQNPTVRFEMPGDYDITLVVKNIKGTDSLCIKKYVIVKPLQYMCQYVLKEIELSPIGILTDDGGPQSDYGSNLNCEVKLTPCVDTLFFKFSEFQLSSGDYLKVYDGKNNSGTPLWDVNTYGNNGLTGDMSNPAFKQTLKSNSGYLYFNFTSNSSNNNRGFIGEWYGTIAQSSKPVAKFAADDTVCMNVEVAFQNLSTGDNLSYEWDFEGTGFPESMAKDPTHTFLFPGLYPVKLTVSNCGGDSSFIKNIYVVSPNTAPNTDFEANNTKPLKAIDIVTFTDLTKGCVDAYKWEITPSSFTIVSDFPNGKNPKVIFNDKTCYNIKLITSYGGNKDTLIKNCYINPIDFCIPTVSNLNIDLGISKVEIGNILNYSSVGTKAYTDYAATQYTYIDRYAWHIISISRNSNKNAMARKVWIDFNIDGDFFDAGEEVLYEPNSTSITFTDTIFVPGTATLGPTRMRIGTNVAGFTLSPCGPSLIGEYEDYRVIIRDYSLPPVVTLIGPDTVSVEQCNKFNDPGVTATSNLFGNMANKVVKTDNVDWSYPGLYWIKYTVTDSFNNKGEATRFIIITQEKKPPILTLKGNNPDTCDIGFKYLDPGFSSYDSCSGVDANTVTGVVYTDFAGKYYIKYKSKDKVGNADSIFRTVVVLDRIPPTIILKGISPMVIPVFSTYIDSGVTVSDNYDKNLTVKTTGSVNTSKIGNYTLTYTVTDSSGNGPVSVQRLVQVIDDIKPTFTAKYNDGDTIILDVNTQLAGLNVKSTDNYDATVTIDSFGSFYQAFSDGIAKTLGLYTLIYKSTDKSNNSAYLSFVIKVLDRIKPVIKLKGAGVLNVCRYKTADTLDLLFTLTDNYDNNPTAWVDGTYYTDYLPARYIGLFNIVYHAKDASGNVADSVIRYVNIYECGSIDDNIQNNNAIKIYPNPNNGNFYLVNQMNVPIEYAKVYNSFGQQVDFNFVEVNAGNIYSMQLENIAKGIYIIQVYSRLGLQSIKVNVY